MPVFVCDEESDFYSRAVETLCFPYVRDDQVVIEFGVGSGMPIINAVLRGKRLASKVVGYEIDEQSADVARENIRNNSLSDQYTVLNKNYFDDAHDKDWLISNPPYLPCQDNNMKLPALWGGEEGCSVILRLLDEGYSNVMILVPSISAPEYVFSYARRKGYKLSKWLGGNLVFGEYSREPNVFSKIQSMKNDGKAYYNGSVYGIVACLFKKDSETDNAAEAIKFLSGE